MKTGLKAKVRWFRLQILALPTPGRFACNKLDAHVETRVHMYGIRVHTVPVFAPIFEQRKPSYGEGRNRPVVAVWTAKYIVHIYVYILYIYVCVYMWYTIAKYIMYV